MHVRITLFGLLLASLAPPSAAQEGSLPSASDLATYLNAKPHTVVLDVRPKEMWRRWRLKCDSCTHVNLPIEDMTIPKEFFLEEVAEIAVLRDLKEKKVPFVLVCWVGILTAHISRELTEAGYGHHIVEGGLDALPQYMIEGEKPPRPELPRR